MKGNFVIKSMTEFSKLEKAKETTISASSLHMQTTKIGEEEIELTLKIKGESLAVVELLKEHNIKDTGQHLPFQFSKNPQRSLED